MISVYALQTRVRWFRSQTWNQRQLSVVLVSGLLTDTGLAHVCNVLTIT